MSRRRVIAKREILPDPKFKNKTLAKFINHVMVNGKKAVAESIVYGALETVQERVAGSDPVEVFEKGLEAIAPMVEVKSLRVGGATYQVPMEIRNERAQALGIRWIIDVSRRRPENTMTARLSAELVEASENRGGAVKKREDTHRMAEANKAFAHYRW